MTNDDHWIKANQELAKLVVLATLPPIEPDFDFTISYNNIWDTWNYGNINGICRLVNERRHGMITNEEARKAIEKYQKEHRLPFGTMMDVTAISSKEGVDVINNVIEQVSKKVEEDTELWAICEMAKMYMQGVRPVYPVKLHGEWIPVSERLPDNDGGCYLVSLDNGQIVVADSGGIIENHNFEPKMLAWQLLPEPYIRGEENGK